MDELGLTVEGIINKTQKLILRNQQLNEKVETLEAQQQQLVEQINEQARLIINLEEKLSYRYFLKAFEKSDSLQARQKVNELLREIEKCYALLNR